MTSVNLLFLLSSSKSYLSPFSKTTSPLLHVMSGFGFPLMMACHVSDSPTFVVTSFNSWISGHSRRFRKAWYAINVFYVSVFFLVQIIILADELTLDSASPYLFFSFSVYSPVSSFEHFGTLKVTVVSVSLSDPGLLSTVIFKRLSSE